MMILLFATVALAAEVPLTPFPVFLKAGFSSVLEFEEAPSRVVLGDGQKFQVEKLDRSLVIRTLAPFASTNMFVYFTKKEARLFVLTASEDAQPTFHKSFTEPPVIVKPAGVSAETRVSSPKARSARLHSARFDGKKDYLTIDFSLTAGGDAPLRPKWKLSQLMHGGSAIAPHKLWAERKEVAKSAEVRARLVFAKPNVPRDLSAATVLIPMEGGAEPIRIPLKGVKR